LFYLKLFNGIEHTTALKEPRGLVSVCDFVEGIMVVHTPCPRKKETEMFFCNISYKTRAIRIKVS